MPGEFVGRPRPLWKILVYTLLTFGVYGRVYLYKTVREIDGHQVYFLDLRLYKISLILPFIGPLGVKLRLVRLVRELVQHDVTAPAFPTRLLRLLAFVPLVPAFHMVLQWHLERHWALHRRMDDLAGRRTMLDQLRHHAATEDDRARVAQMEDEILERERALEEARKAALALHEARAARARARRKMKAAGVREPLGERLSAGKLAARLRRRSPNAIDVAGETPSADPSVGVTETVPVRRRRFGLFARTRAPDETPPGALETESPPPATPPEPSVAEPPPEPAPVQERAAPARARKGRRRA